MREPLRSWTRKDFRIDWFSGTGAGGQHRNKHQNCIRITDIETGLTSVGQDHKSRKRNMADALDRIAVKLVAHHWPKVDKVRAPVDVTVRTYNEAENRVTDKASGKKWSADDFDIGDAILARKLEE